MPCSLCFPLSFSASTPLFLWRPSETGSDSSPPTDKERRLYRCRCVRVERLPCPSDVPSNNLRSLTLRLVLLIAVSIFERLSIEYDWPLWLWMLSIGVFRSLSLCRRSVSDRSGGFTLVELSVMPLPVIFQSFIFNLPLQPLISCDCGVVCASGSLDKDCSIHSMYSVDSDLFVDLCLPWDAPS